MPNQNAPVAEAEKPEVVAAQAVTDSGESGVTNVTPAAPAAVPDVDARIAEYERKLQAAQTDVNQVKSALQKREAALEKQFAIERQALQKQLQEIRMQGMDAEQRKAYEATLITEEYQTLQQRLEETERKNTEYSNMLNAQNFFVGQGVPLDKLNFADGYEGLVNSGWAHLSAELAELRAQLKNPKPAQTPEPLKQAPPVLTDKGAPGGGTTWEQLIKKYGSAENVYQLVESGNLDPNILPV